MIASSNKSSRRDFLQTCGFAAAAGAAYAIMPAVGNATASQEAATSLQRLGYPPDQKLLILHADDLACAHSENRASFTALEAKAVSSASVIVPAPWLPEVADYFNQHPEMDLGLHLALTSEWDNYRWGPVASWNEVRSLRDPDGYLWHTHALFVQHAEPSEVEIELRAQVERAIQIGIKPTHLDSHMMTLFTKPEHYAALVKVGHEYGLPFRATRDMKPELLKLLSPDDLVVDSWNFDFSAKPRSANTEEWRSNLAGVIRELKPGVYGIIVHLAYDNEEFRAVTAGHRGMPGWRQKQFDDVMSSQCRQALADNKITLTTYRELYRRLKTNQA